MVDYWNEWRDYFRRLTINDKVIKKPLTQCWGLLIVLRGSESANVMTTGCLLKMIYLC